MTRRPSSGARTPGPIPTVVAGCFAVLLAQVAYSLPGALNGTFQQEFATTGSQLTWITAAFAIPGIERVRIQCRPENVRSARVPEKLGYRRGPDRSEPDGPVLQQWLVERGDWLADDLASPAPS